MFCSSCGSSQDSQSLFCPSCGAKLQNISAAEPESPAVEKKSKPQLVELAKQKKIWIPAASVVAALILSLVFLPKSFELRIHVDDVYGGVFDSACEIDDDAKSLIPKELIVTDKSNGSGGVKVPVEFSKDNSGECVGITKASVGAFGVAYIFNGSEQVGSFKSSEISADDNIVTIEAAVTRGMKVNFNLYEKADRCSGSVSNWSCSWNWDEYFGLKLYRSTGKCKGKAGFSDIHAGTTVIMRGLSNGKTLTGALVNDTYDLVSVKSKQIVCKFYADFDSVPNDEEGYEITVSNRGDVVFTKETLKLNDWTADLVLNK